MHFWAGFLLKKIKKNFHKKCLLSEFLNKYKRHLLFSSVQREDLEILSYFLFFEKHVFLMPEFVFIFAELTTISYKFDKHLNTHTHTQTHFLIKKKQLLFFFR